MLVFGSSNFPRTRLNSGGTNPSADRRSGDASRTVPRCSSASRSRVWEFGSGWENYFFAWSRS